MRTLEKDYFTPKGKNSDVIMNSVKKHIRNTDCNYMTLDISNLNPLEASKIAIICSTDHYLKYPQGTVDCIVETQKIEDLIKPMTLGNMKFVTMRKKN